jgi:hypothetical protein
MARKAFEDLIEKARVLLDSAIIEMVGAGARA